MKKILTIALLIMLCVTIKTASAEAANYDVYVREDNQYIYLNNSTAIVEGYNVTHGFSKRLPFTFIKSGGDIYLRSLFEKPRLTA